MELEYEVLKQVRVEKLNNKARMSYLGSAGGKGKAGVGSRFPSFQVYLK